MHLVKAIVLLEMGQEEKANKEQKKAEELDSKFNQMANKMQAKQLGR